MGAFISTFYIVFPIYLERSAKNIRTSLANLIFISMLLTGFGIYDRFGQFAGAGTAVPVTGFGNSVIAACIEHRTEGFVLGVGVTCLNWLDLLSCLAYFRLLSSHLLKRFSFNGEGYKCYKDTEHGYSKTNQSSSQQGSRWTI